MKRIPHLVALAALVVACSPASDSDSDGATTIVGASTTAPEITIVPTTTTLPTVQPGEFDRAADLEAFFDEYGGEEAFGQPAVAAVFTYLAAEEALRASDFLGARELLDTLWERYPIGDPVWFNTPYSPHGAQLGSPTAYYGLRMLDEFTDQMLASDEREPDHIRLTVVLVGCSEGTQSTTEEELDALTGKQVHLTLNEELDANADEWFDQATWTFRQYVRGITGNNLIVDLGIQRLPDLCVPVATARNSGAAIAGVENTAPIWEALPAEVTAATDMWWVVYPSDVPTEGSLVDTAFVTGGMGLHPSGAPVFTSDDLWVVRKPVQLGDGPYTSVERRTYFAQWMQTEFFHHLFRSYPEFELEANGNDWFDRDNWPEDFVGVMEPDYFQEALHRRLAFADVPLSVTLRYAPPRPGTLANLDTSVFVGDYDGGSISADGDNFIWSNGDGESWTLTWDGENGRLLTGPENPYSAFSGGDAFTIALARDENGDYTDKIIGFRFLGGLYLKQ